MSLAVELEDGSQRSIGEAWAMDFSGGGMSLLTECPLAVDDQLIVNFFGSPLWQRFYSRVSVAHCEKLVGSIFHVGVRFVD
ncbi:MAG: PilZ domain-containing protein [Planctomycetes bacterium]|nr:PilZ domain-containing protein [Planctomycetota bacterium]